MIVPFRLHWVYPECYLYICSLWKKGETLWPFHGHTIPTSSRTNKRMEEGVCTTPPIGRLIFFTPIITSSVRWLSVLCMLNCCKGQRSRLKGQGQSSLGSFVPDQHAGGATCRHYCIFYAIFGSCLGDGHRFKTTACDTLLPLINDPSPVVMINSEGNGFLVTRWLVLSSAYQYWQSIQAEAYHSAVEILNCSMDQAWAGKSEGQIA